MRAINSSRVRRRPKTSVLRRLRLLTPVLGASSANAENTPPPPANKRNCQNTVPYQRWFADFKREALAEGIHEATINETIGGLSPDNGIIARDRKQGFFSQTFIDFYFKLAT